MLFNEMRDSERLSEIIPKAVAILRKSQHLNNEQVHKELVKEGIRSDIAAHLVEFVPMVYARLILQRSGARFPNSFKRVHLDGSLEERVLANEPVWNAAVAFASSELGRGAGSELLAVATRSAEFHTANQLLNQGSNLQNIVFTPALLTWPENGPDES